MAKALIRYKGACDEKVSLLVSFPWKGGEVTESSFSSKTTILTNSWNHAERLAWRNEESAIKSINWRAVTLEAKPITHLHVAFVVDQLVCPECMKWMHTTMTEFAIHVRDQWGLTLIARAYKVRSVATLPGEYHEYVTDIVQNGWVTGVGQYSTVVGLVDSATNPSLPRAPREEKKTSVKKA